jgi:hypothetical protein
MTDDSEGFAAHKSAMRQDIMNRKDEKDVTAGVTRTGPGEEPHVLLPREAQGRIGQHLRRIYGEILSEPLPDKFSQLLDNLAKTERSE